MCPPGLVSEDPWGTWETVPLCQSARHTCQPAQRSPYRLTSFQLRASRSQCSPTVCGNGKRTWKRCFPRAEGRFQVPVTLIPSVPGRQQGPHRSEESVCL